MVSQKGALTATAGVFPISHVLIVMLKSERYSVQSQTAHDDRKINIFMRFPMFSYMTLFTNLRWKNFWIVRNTIFHKTLAESTTSTSDLETRIWDFQRNTRIIRTSKPRQAALKQVL